MNKLIDKTAEEISFRLLATTVHPDHEWLKEVLKKLIKDGVNDFFVDSEESKKNVLD